MQHLLGCGIGNKHTRVVIQFVCSNLDIQSVLLVGGFAASEWLYPELKKHLTSQHLEVSRPDAHVFVPSRRKLFGH
jgi:hypothetical protein